MNSYFFQEKLLEKLFPIWDISLFSDLTFIQEYYGMFSAVIQYFSFVKENIFDSVLSLNPQLQLKEVLN